MKVNQQRITLEKTVLQNLQYKPVEFICCLLSYGIYLAYENDGNDSGIASFLDNAQDSQLEMIACQHNCFAIKLGQVIYIVHKGTTSLALNELIDAFKLLYSSINQNNMLLDGRHPFSVMNCSQYHFSRDVRLKLQGLDKYRQCEIIETGWSIGAIYAEICASLFKSRSITFDSPGTGNIINRGQALHDLSEQLKRGLSIKDLIIFPKSCDYKHHAESNFTSFLSTPNLINTLFAHCGDIRRLYIPYYDQRGQPICASGELLNSQNLQVLQKLLSSPDYPDDLCNYAFEQIKQLFSSYASSLQYLHSIQNIYHCFDPHLGYPYLQSQMHGWPSHAEFVDMSTKWIVECRPHIATKLSSSITLFENSDCGKVSRFHKNRLKEDALAYGFSVYRQYFSGISLPDRDEIKKRLAANELSALQLRQFAGTAYDFYHLFFKESADDSNDSLFKGKLSEVLDISSADIIIPPDEGVIFNWSQVINHLQSLAEIYNRILAYCNSETYKP